MEDGGVVIQLDCNRQYVFDLQVVVHVDEAVPRYETGCGGEGEEGASS